METLKEKLKSFHFPWNDETALTKKFAELAPYFISGGCIKIREDYRIYPTTVEFYFHSEDKDGVHDPIVYHRNNKYVKGEIPYFPMFTLHAHDSGYDITFENPAEKYRASVLIREYQVWDKKQSCWLKWDTTKQQFCACLKGQNPINKQVLYLKYILNGFTMSSGSLIDWIDATERLKPSEIDSKPRQNVPLYIQKTCENAEIEYEKVTIDMNIDKEFERQYKNDSFNIIHVSQPESFKSNTESYLKDLKPWKFSRKEPVPKPTK